MRLALVRRRYDACGGAELYLQRLVEALLAAGEQPELVAESWSANQPGVPVHRIATTGGRIRRWRQFTVGAEAVLRRERFDCVLSLERGVAADVYRAGDGVHAVWVENWRRWGCWWKRPFAGRGAFHAALLAADRRSLDPRHTRRVIVNSEMVRDEIVAHFAFPRDRIHLVRNGVELDCLQSGNRQRLREAWQIPAEACVLLFAGSGWERKGLAWLRRALAGLPRERFVLVVAGRGRRPWRPAANERYVGPLPRSEMPDALAAADLLVLPTLYDPCSNACLEALAAGLPVITTRQNGAAELISEGINGSIITSPNRISELTAAITAWADRKPSRPACTRPDLSLTRNVQEIMAVLERAWHEKG
jgi:UDP-glucose:(heptosyl)LPS alpha-1,3-glucosyltransferase